MNSITQDMRYRQSLLEYARKDGVAKVSRKYNRARSYIISALCRCLGIARSTYYYERTNRSDECDLEEAI